MRYLVSVPVLSLCGTILIVILTNVGVAQVMTSSNYQIQSDSVNFGGGYSSSTNYSIESTGGEVATGELSSPSYVIRSGFQQMQSSYIALSANGNVSLSPSIPGVSGGYATGSASVTVTTDSLGGYKLTIEASDSPAMQSGGNSIPDYVPSGISPDFNFDIGSSDAYFGFSPEGSDVVQRFLDDVGICDQPGGSDTLNKCWDGLSTSAVNIAVGSGSNHPAGAETVIQFQVGVGGSVVQPTGSYVATTTITAIPL